MNKTTNDIIKLYNLKEFLRKSDKAAYELICKLERKSREELVTIALANCLKLTRLGYDYEPVFKDVEQM